MLILAAAAAAVAAAAAAAVLGQVEPSPQQHGAAEMSPEGLEQWLSQQEVSRRSEGKSVQFRQI